MKKTKQVTLFLLIAISVLLLSGCASNSALTNAASWPGMTADGDIVYVSYDSSIQAVSEKGLLWKYPSESDNKIKFFAPPVIDDGKVYAATYQNEVYVLDQEQGTLINKISLGSDQNKILASPAIGDGMLIIPSNDGLIYGYSLDNLVTPLWTTHHASEIWVKPVILEKKVYFASLDKKIYALDLETGEILKSQLTDGAIMSDLVVSDDKIYFSTLGNDVSVYDPATDQINDLFSTQNEIWASPLIAGENIIVADMKGNVYCNDRSTGKSVWTLSGITAENAPFIANPILLGDGNILLAAENGDLMVYDADGKSVNVRSGFGKIMTTPVLIGDSVVTAMIPGDALLRAYSFDLKEAWWYLESSDTTPAITETVAE